MAGRPISEALATARLVGDKTYEGTEHEACHTTTRYVSGGGCVHCARQKQAIQRGALKQLMAARGDTHIGMTPDTPLTDQSPPASDLLLPKEPWE